MSRAGMERAKVPELTAEQNRTKELIERAPTLTDVIGVLYDRVPELHTTQGQDLSTEEIISGILDTVEAPPKAESQVTNSLYALRTLIREKFNAKQYTPTVADQLIRQNFKRWGKSGKSYAMPISDMPRDPEFYRQPCATPGTLSAIMQQEEIRPTMRSSTNEGFVRRILASKNLFGSADTIEELITLLNRQKIIAPDVRSSPQEQPKSINTKPIVLLMEDWMKGRGSDKPMNILFDILQDHFELSILIRKLALEHDNDRQRRSSEQLKDFIDRYDIRNVTVTTRGRRYKVLGAATNGRGVRVRFYDVADPTRTEALTIKSIEELRTQRIVFEDSAIQRSLEEFSKAV